MSRSCGPSTIEGSDRLVRASSCSRKAGLRMRALVGATSLCAVLLPAALVSSPAGAATKSHAGGAVTTIIIKNFAFSPSRVTVKPGSKIKVINKDGVTHTLTSLSNKFNTGDVNPGQTKTFTAPTKPGHYPYRCNIHQFMTGMLTVS